jgi:hypothetical protein
MRLVLATLVLAALANGCGGGGVRGPAPIEKLGTPTLSLLAAQSALVAGTDQFAFGLVTQQGGLLGGGSPTVWVAKDRSSTPVGPFHAVSHQFSAFEQTGDASPRSPLTTFYAAQVRIPSPGTWMAAAVVRGQISGLGLATVQVVSPAQAVFPVGSKAKATRTPVATSPAKAREICTRTPKPDPLHYISLDRALASGKPTVVTFATPLLCESKICGPVVDEVTVAYQKVGKANANFIHVEEFLPGRDHKPPPATLEHQSPAFKAWGLTTEPWTFVIDRDGVIRARFEGPVVAAEIEAALQPLL